MATQRLAYVTRHTPRLTLGGARLIMTAAARKAYAIGVPMDIAVVDEGGHLLVFNRMDGAKLSSVDISICKAWTAACARRATHEYAEIGQVIGGIGCSSGTVQQDREVAMAGVQAISAAAAPPRAARRRRARIRRTRAGGPGGRGARRRSG